MFANAIPVVRKPREPKGWLRLEGITRNTVIELARDAEITVQECPLTRHDVYTADECFLTGSAAEVIPVVKCDARAIGDGKPGPVTRRIREAYTKLVHA